MTVLISTEYRQLVYVLLDCAEISSRGRADEHGKTIPIGAVNGADRLSADADDFLSKCHFLFYSIRTNGTMAGRSEMSRDRPRNEPAQHRLFVGNLPKAKTERDICGEIGRNTSGLVRVITYKNFEDPALHRGFCFLDYESRAAAVEAKHWLSRYTTFGCRTVVDWADPEPEFDDETMAAVRILFVRQYNGTLSETVLASVFGRFGTVERVKNLKNYSFVHFVRRQDAQAAMDALDGARDIDSGVQIDVLWAKPPADKQSRERMLRNREWRVKRAAGGRYPPAADSSRAAEESATAPAQSAAPVRDPYSNYEHYRYDFGLTQTFDCPSRQQSVAESPSRCPVYCAPCTMAADIGGNDGGGGPRRYRRCDLHEGGDEKRGRDVGATAVEDRHGGHGDCTAAVQDCGNVDANILKFFHRVIIGATVVE